jgi:hypothetical protein
MRLVAEIVARGARLSREPLAGAPTGTFENAGNQRPAIVALNLSNTTGQRGLITDRRRGFGALARDYSTQQPAEETGDQALQHRSPGNTPAQRTRQVVEAPFFQ